MVPDGQYYYFSFQKDSVNQKEIPYYIFYILLEYHFRIVWFELRRFPPCYQKKLVELCIWQYTYEIIFPLDVIFHEHTHRYARGRATCIFSFTSCHKEREEKRWSGFRAKE